MYTSNLEAGKLLTYRGLAFQPTTASVRFQPFYLTENAKILEHSYGRNVMYITSRPLTFGQSFQRYSTPNIIIFKRYLELG